MHHCCGGAPARAPERTLAALLRHRLRHPRTVLLPALSAVRVPFTILPTDIGPRSWVVAAVDGNRNVLAAIEIERIDAERRELVVSVLRSSRYGLTVSVRLRTLSGEDVPFIRNGDAIIVREFAAGDALRLSLTWPGGESVPGWITVRATDPVWCDASAGQSGRIDA